MLKGSGALKNKNYKRKRHIFVPTSTEYTHTHIHAHTHTVCHYNLVLSQFSAVCLYAVQLYMTTYNDTVSVSLDYIKPMIHLQNKSSLAPSVDRDTKIHVLGHDFNRPPPAQ